MVIESDPITADILENTFPGEHEIVVFGTAREALERVAIGRPFDGIFCEVDPPDMPAREVLARLEDGSPRTAMRMVFVVSELKPHRAFLQAKPPKRYLLRPISAAGLREAIASLP